MHRQRIAQVVACAPAGSESSQALSTARHLGNGDAERYDIDRFIRMVRKSRRDALLQIGIHSKTAQGDPAQAVIGGKLAHEIEAAAVGQAEVAHHKIDRRDPHFLFGQLQGFPDDCQPA